VFGGKCLHMLPMVRTQHRTVGIAEPIRSQHKDFSHLKIYLAIGQTVYCFHSTESCLDYELLAVELRKSQDS